MSASTILVLFVLAFATACGPSGKKADTNATEGTKPAAPHTSVAQARQEPQVLVLNGTLLADDQSDVSPVVAGRVVEVLVEPGDVVTEGQPLVRIRDVDFRIRAQMATAAVDQARARLGMSGENIPRPEENADVRSAAADKALAESLLARSESLASQGVYSAQQVEEARARASSATERYEAALNNARATMASLASARASLSEAKSALSESIVRAPFSGEVADRFVSEGEYVSPQNKLVSIVRSDPLRIEIQVPQQNLLDVRVGQKVAVVVDAIADRSFEGTVKYISAAVRADTRGLTVLAVVPNPDRVLRPGLFVQTRIDLGRTEPVAVVPKSAVLSEAGVHRVFVIKDGRVIERVVALGQVLGDNVVISNGVSAGESVATDELTLLSDGQPVTAPQAGGQ